jgi:ribosomal-protein-alanine N-acetyltransferase
VDVLLADMTAADLDEVEHIAEGAFDPPWTRRGLEDELARDVARCRVARDVPGGPVLAYAIWWTIAGEQQLLAVATARDARRRGLARALLEDMLAESGATECFLDVRASNAAAIALYEALGFAHVTTRAGYYRDGEDARVMSRRA